MKTTSFSFGGIVWFVALISGTLAAEPPSITLTEFGIFPKQLERGESFTIRARATAKGTKVRSFLLRTADDVRRENRIAGFTLYSNGKYYMAEDGTFFLKDNGQRDRDPRPLAFALQVSTQGWKSGTYVFAFFASCRPSKGPFVVARHDFAVIVRDHQVVIEDLGGSGAGNNMFVQWNVCPTVIHAGDPVAITVDLKRARGTSIRLTDPYYIRKSETLPGFRYDEAKKKSVYANMPQPVRSGRNFINARWTFTLDTHGWPSGVRYFRLDAVGASGRPLDYRCFAIKVRSRRDQLDVTADNSYYFRPGTHFERFIRLRNGTLL